MDICKISKGPEIFDKCSFTHLHTDPVKQELSFPVLNASFLQQYHAGSHTTELQINLEALLTETNLWIISMLTSITMTLVGDLAEVPLGDREVFMEVFHAALLREFSHSVPLPSKYPLGGQEPLQTHRASGVDACCTDTNLSS